MDLEGASSALVLGFSSSYIVTACVGSIWGSFTLSTSAIDEKPFLNIIKREFSSAELVALGQFAIYSNSENKVSRFSTIPALFLKLLWPGCAGLPFRVFAVQYPQCFTGLDRAGLCAEPCPRLVWCIVMYVTLNFAVDQINVFEQNKCCNSFRKLISLSIPVQMLQSLKTRKTSCTAHNSLLLKGSR